MNLFEYKLIKNLTTSNELIFAGKYEPTLKGLWAVFLKEKTLFKFVKHCTTSHNDSYKFMLKHGYIKKKI